MHTPLKSYSFQFSSDGTSTSLLVDLSTLPFSIDFSGVTPVGILNPTLSSTVVSPSVTGTVAGTLATFSFPFPPSRYDPSAQPVVYTLAFLLQLAPAAQMYAQAVGAVGYGNSPYGEGGYGQ